MTRRRPLTLLAVAGLLLGACGPSPAESSPSPSAVAQSPIPRPTPEPSPSPTATPLVPGDALLPNLVMEPLDEWRVESRDGRRLLRMTTIFSNYGLGPFELHGSRASAAETAMLLEQIVYTASGDSRRVPTTVEARYAGDGHDHWHAQGVVTLRLRAAGDTSSVTMGEKIHFCFFDDVRTGEDLGAADAGAYFQRAWCGTPDSLEVRMGVSVGWGDRYGWDFPFQQIDITGLPGGRYELRATVDDADDFVEADDTDNCTMSRFTLPATGEGQIVTVDASGLPC